MTVCVKCESPVSSEDQSKAENLHDITDKTHLALNTGTEIPLKIAAASPLGTATTSDDLLFCHLVTLTVLTRDTQGPMQIPHTSSPNKSIPIENIPMISPSLHVANRPMINRNKLLIQHSLLFFLRKNHRFTIRLTFFLFLSLTP